MLLATGWWFSPGTLVSSTNKTDCHDITEILLKVAFNTITLEIFKLSRINRPFAHFQLDSKIIHF